jgi:hypothetical protein
MGALRDDITSSAQHIAAALTSSGYRADFTATSLWEVDRFLEDQTSRGRPRPRGLLADDFGARVFGLGAYVGHVLADDLGGTWRTDDEDPEGEINIAVVLDGGSTVFPVLRVIARIKNGAEDAVAPYAGVLGVAVGPRPTVESRRRRFWG